MTLIHHLPPRAALQAPPPRRRRSWRELLAVAAAALVAAAVAVPVLAAPPPPTDADVLAAYIDTQSQGLTVASQSARAPLTRDSFGASPGIATLSAGATNYDWAKLVLLLAGWPQTDDSVTVFVRWMRQENYVDSWWNRNNPLNNGWGSGGGGGLGSYDSLVTAAENAAEALTQNPGYADIAAAFAAGAPSTVIESAIWASPWASGNYNWGSHWSYAEVPVIQAPAEAW